MKFGKRMALLLAVCLLLSLPVGAALPYTGYIYDAWGTAVPAPEGYTPSTVVDGNQLTGKALSAPADLFAAEDGTVYIADTGNDRILVCSSDLQLIRTVSAYRTGNSTEPIKKPGGLYADADGFLYISLPEEGRVIRLDREDRLCQSFTRPDTDLIDEATVFRPTNVIVNTRGTVFVLADGLHLGALIYDQSGRFFGFYGANEVDVTISLLVDYYWKKIMSQVQVDKMTRYVPVQFNGFDMGSDNFVYTCTSVHTSTTGEIRKMNAIGSNVLTQREQNVPALTGDYGDLNRDVYRGQTRDTFVDICVSDRGLIYALDKTQGRIFEYDQESRLLHIFGAQGYQLGSFQNPVAIDCVDRTVYVLDKDKGSVTVFEPTAYGALVEDAVALYTDGRYAEAKGLWEQVLHYNQNCELAYEGIGKALYEEGRYREAMTYADYGYDRVGYSRAFKEYRLELIRIYFPWVLTGGLILIAAGGTVRAVLRRKRAANEGKRGGTV